MIGRTISHYEILDRLGRGGMGVVYKAVDSRLGRQVAIKFLSSPADTTPTATERFVSEAKAASALDHPNIGTIYEIDETPEGELFIVMAYYEGQSLRDRLNRSPVTAEQAIDIARQTARGLDRAHRQGIVHRDIKPANLLLTPDGLVKILDFGVAKVADLHLTEQGAIVGTPIYMSPEQARGERVDARSDIWSLGVVLFEMLTKTVPFARDNKLELIEAIGSEPTPAWRVPSGAPAALHHIVERALAKEPDDRFQTMHELDSALGELGFDLLDQSLAETMDKPMAGAMSGTGRQARATARPTGGERRQVTVLSCELSRYAELAERLDPEDLNELLVEYHEICRGATSPLGGHIDHFEDDRLTAYFGYPNVHEDDARRATRAARQIVERVAALHERLGEDLPALRALRLRCRAGIHTGPVVIGAGARGKVVGQAPRAARLVQEAADPGEILVTDDTLRLLRNAFACEALGPRSLPGFTETLSLHRVVSEAAAATESPFGQRATEFVGRHEELGLIADRWSKAKDGMGQVVTLSGEAGIGKSRLGRVARESLRAEATTRFELFCSPYHIDSPLYPVVQWLDRHEGLAGSSPPEARQESLRALLDSFELDTPEELALFSRLLSIPLPDGHPELTWSPPKQKQALLAGLVKMVLDSAMEGPVFLAVEDLHWVDPSTLELLGLLVDQVPTLPILGLFSFRPEFQPPWGQRAHLSQITLTRLGRTEAERLVLKVTRGKSLPDDLLAEIVKTSDGVPLFAEELTKAVLESGKLREGDGRYELEGGLSGLEIPKTLNGSLLARLDRLGSAKEVAQWGAVLGREFPYAWLEAACPLGESLLGKELSRLVQSELLYQRGVPPRARYTFKHALVKDAAYDSLLKRDRRAYHGRIAATLASDFPRVAEKQPELLGHHYTEAGLAEPAVEHWHRAARQALERANHMEVVNQARQGLQLISQLPEGPERDRREIELQHMKGAAIALHQGYAAPELESIYLRMMELCLALDDQEALVDAYTGLAGTYLLRARFEESLDYGAKARLLAVGLGSDAMLANIDYVRGVNLVYQGRLGEAKETLDASIELCNEIGTPVVRGGHEVGVTARCTLAVTRWLQGFPDEALRHIEQAVTLGENSAFAYNHAYALFHGAFIHQFRREPGPAREYADKVVALSVDKGYFWAVTGRVVEGWAHARTVDPATRPSDESSAELGPELLGMFGALEALLATGTRLTESVYRIMLVESLARWGFPKRALEELARAIETVQETGERSFEADLYRLRGQLLLHVEPDRLDEAEEAFRIGLATAQEIGAHMLELRVATHLSRLLASSSRSEEGRTLLESICGRFTEGRDTPDLSTARALLAELRPG